MFLCIRKKIVLIGAVWNEDRLCHREMCALELKALKRVFYNLLRDVRGDSHNEDRG